MSMVCILCAKEFPPKAFTFTLATDLPLKFSFDTPVSRPLKRPRPLHDVDGEGQVRRKKRRLRLQFFTSRLGCPFSQPASNIIHHANCDPLLGPSKQKAASKNILRKTAIMNRVHIWMDAVKESMSLGWEGRNEIVESLIFRDKVLQTQSRELRLPSSPLGISNYDAFDAEDEDPEESLDQCSAIYSDFNFMRLNCEAEEDYEFLGKIDGLDAWEILDTPPATATQSWDR